MTVGLVITIILFLTRFGGTLEGALATISVLPGIWLPMFIEFGVYGLVIVGHLVLMITIWRGQ
jgi:hypothetical protein